MEPADLLRQGLHLGQLPLDRLGSPSLRYELDSSDLPRSNPQPIAVDNSIALKSQLIKAFSGTRPRLIRGRLLLSRLICIQQGSN